LREREIKRGSQGESGWVGRGGGTSVQPFELETAIERDIEAGRERESERASERAREIEIARELGKALPHQADEGRIRRRVRD